MIATILVVSVIDSWPARIFDTLLADGMPKSELVLGLPVLFTNAAYAVYFNFKQHQISPAAYLPDWLIPLFLDHLPFEACARLWDILLLEGDSFLFRASLAILAVLEPRLFFPDRRELLELLKYVSLEDAPVSYDAHGSPQGGEQARPRSREARRSAAERCQVRDLQRR